MGGLKSKLRRPKSSSRKEKDSSSVKRPSKKKTNLPESQSARKTVDRRLPFSNYRQIFSIRNAWKAVSRHMEDSAKETLIRLLHHHPEHRARLEDIKDITDEEEMRINETFETVAMDIYQVFDDVINNLEKVDAALRDIKLASETYPLDKRMMRDMQQPFIETIKFNLGSDRFTEATEDNYILLYKFVEDEIGKYLIEVEVNSDIGGGEPNTTDGDDPKKEDNVKPEPDNSETLANKEDDKTTIENAVTEGEENTLMEGGENTLMEGGENTLMEGEVCNTTNN